MRGHLSKTVLDIQKRMEEIRCFEMKIFRKDGGFHVSFSILKTREDPEPAAFVSSFLIFDKDDTEGFEVGLSNGASWVIRQICLSNPEVIRILDVPGGMIRIPGKGMAEILCDPVTERPEGTLH